MRKHHYDLTPDVPISPHRHSCCGPSPAPASLLPVLEAPCERWHTSAWAPPCCGTGQRPPALAVPTHRQRAVSTQARRFVQMGVFTSLGAHLRGDCWVTGTSISNLLQSCQAGSSLSRTVSHSRQQRVSMPVSPCPCQHLSSPLLTVTMLGV